MLLVPVPAVIEPFVIDQVYVAPAPASTTLAELPVERAQVALAAVIAADGTALIATSAEPLSLQPLFETVTERCTVPDELAVYVMLRVPLPAVIEPFVMDQP
jgi:hypothetical protein